MNPIFTIGHSNITLEEFQEKLGAYSIDLLIDVRSHPGSKTVPWTNKANLMSVFKDHYLWMPELGGPTEGDYSDPLNFPKHRIGKTRPEFAKMKKEDRPHEWWNCGLRDFDEWMGRNPKFLEGLKKLDELAGKQRVVIMCSEIKWWSCHRSMISDAYCALGGEATHIWTAKRADSHPLGDRLTRYTPETQKLWLGADKPHHSQPDLDCNSYTESVV